MSLEKKKSKCQRKPHQPPFKHGHSASEGHKKDISTSEFKKHRGNIKTLTFEE